MIVLIEMNDNLTVKPYHLNTQSVANKLVGVMFGWRKKDSSDLQNICPYCSTPNEIGSKDINKEGKIINILSLKDDI